MEKYECGFCSTTFESERERKCHMQAHKNPSSSVETDSYPSSSSSDKKSLKGPITEEELEPLRALATIAVNQGNGGEFKTLGGHTGHGQSKKRKLDYKATSSSSSPVVADHSIHKCTVCSKEFSSGPALGGHMRKHRPLS